MKIQRRLSCVFSYEIIVIYLFKIYRYFKSKYCHTLLFKRNYEAESNIFRTDAVKIIKLTIRLIDRHQPRSSSLPHIDTGPTISSIYGTLPGSPFLSQCQALSAIRHGAPRLYKTRALTDSVSFLEIGRSHRVPNQGRTVGGEWQPFCISPETAGWGRKCETGRFSDPSWKSPQVTTRLQLNACENCPRPPNYVKLGTLIR
jgi:hypothetical protein